MVNWLGLILPFAYLTVLIGSLVTFASLYRKRNAGKPSPIQLLRGIKLHITN
jgi:translocation protein SEC66